MARLALFLGTVCLVVAYVLAQQHNDPSNNIKPLQPMNDELSKWTPNQQTNLADSNEPALTDADELDDNDDEDELDQQNHYPTDNRNNNQGPFWPSRFFPFQREPMSQQQEDDIDNDLLAPRPPLASLFGGSNGLFGMGRLPDLSNFFHSQQQGLWKRLNQFRHQVSEGEQRQIINYNGETYEQICRTRRLDKQDDYHHHDVRPNESSQGEISDVTDAPEYTKRLPEDRPNTIQTTTTQSSQL